MTVFCVLGGKVGGMDRFAGLSTDELLKRAHNVLKLSGDYIIEFHQQLADFDKRRADFGTETF